MPRRLHRLILPPLLLGLLGSQCGWNAAGQTGCRLVDQPHPLPAELEESSGVAVSVLRTDLLWSHNDGGHDARLYALDLQGRVLGSFSLGVRNRDWEDIATAPCESGGCIYIADTGDNGEVRADAELLRVVEPGSGEGTRTLEVERFPLVLPYGPRDIEALFVLPGEEVYFVTKGRNHAASVYRYPPPLRPGVEVRLEEVQTLSDGPLSLPSQITGADAARDGSVVVLRTYQSLTFYRVEDGRLVPVEGGRADLRTLQEPQGEAVALGPAGQVVLTSESGSFGGIAAVRVLECGSVG